ncbi:MAG TPA: acyl-CoA dehydrogenase family protein, partial [Bacillota bacterium]
FGDEEQKQRLLPALAAGERLATVAVTEAGGGSDPSGTKTTARFESRPEGDGYVLDGRKVFITNAHLADVQVVLAKSKEEPAEFTAFIIERGMPGFKLGREEHKLGFAGCNTGEVILDKCFVPVRNRLGKEGAGLKAALKAIGEAGRSGMAGVSLGIIRACVEAAGSYAAKREVSGRPLNRYQGIQWKLADLVTDRDAASLLAYRACWLKDQGQRCDAEMAMAKYFASEAAIRAAKLAAEVFGGYGYMKEFPTERYLRDAQLTIPSAGTSDVMRMVIARAANP